MERGAGVIVSGGGKFPLPPSVGKILLPGL